MPLNVRQERLIDALVDGAPSIAAAGQIAGYSHRAAAHRAVSTIDAQTALSERKRDRRDKAHGILANLEATQRKAARVLERIEERDLDPVLAGQLLKLLGDARYRELETRQRFDLSTEAEQIHEGRAEYHERMRRWGEAVLKLGSDSNVQRILRVVRRIVPPQSRV